MEKGDTLMKCLNCKNILIVGACTVVILSTGVIVYLNKKKFYNPDKLLEEVKTYFMDVKGSYIVQQPLNDPNINANKPIYLGGISATKNGKLVDYDFYADAYTGEVLNIIEL